MNSKEWYQKSIKECFEELNTRKSGLSDREAQARLKKFGLNRLEEFKKISPLKLFLEQFKNLLVVILFVATIISFFIGDIVDAVLIIVLIMILVVIGFFQEYKAEKVLEALKKLTAPKAKVLRDGKEVEIESENVVPGDIILLNAGDKVPAGARIFESINLEADESILTGESVIVQKDTKAIKDKVMISERKNIVFAGTVITQGRGKAVVVETGMNTEIGKIAKIIQTERKEIPFKAKMSQFSKHITFLIISVCSLTFTVGILRGEDLVKMFLTILSLSVSAMPEALPLIVTVTLAIGVYQMVKHNVIIRRLPAVETLGSATIICSDKTGTMTKNEMTVQEIYTDSLIKVTGAGYKPEGKFYKNDKEINPLQDKQLFSLLRTGMLCNNSELNLTLLGGWEVKGSPSEGALLAVAGKAGLKDMRKQHKMLKEISFSSERKIMSKVYSENNENMVYVKGASEYVLRLCKYYNGRKLNKKMVEKILKINEEMASKGLYTLALAYKKLHKIDSKNIENDLNFLGMVGMSDPIRPEVKDAIEKCKQAGIKVVMITGDHLATAKTIAKQIGLDINNHNVITGVELDALGDEEFEKQSEDIVVYARTSHEHKFRIITALQKKGNIVAMTGDGVNDATALKKANIGVAMGVKGSDVAKEASDMILTDDNFASIVNAVEEGRKIYDNIKKSTLYLLSTALAEVLLVTIGILTGFPLILFATQILWINLVTEGIPAVGLAFESRELDIMKRKPRNPKEKLLSKDILYRIIGRGILMFIGCMILFLWLFNDLTKARTMTFTTLVIFELFNIFNCRSLRNPLTKIGLFSNKILILLVGTAFLLQVVIVQIPIIASMFKVIPLNLFEWMISIAMGSLVLVAGEIRKSFKFLNWLPF